MPSWGGVHAYECIPAYVCCVPDAITTKTAIEVAPGSTERKKTAVHRPGTPQLTEIISLFITAKC